jgi:hypothetical protein
LRVFGWFKKNREPSPVAADSADDHWAALDELRALQAAADEAHRGFVAEGRVAAPEDTDAWVAAGESGYVNCLLTVLAEGSVRTATVSAGQPLPHLDALAGEEPSARAWAERLRFPLESLSARVVLDTLAESFELRAARSGTLKTVLVRAEGSPLAVLFTARWVEPGVAVAVTALRPT